MIDTVSIMGPRDYWGFKRFRAQRFPSVMAPVAADIFLWGLVPDAKRGASRIGGIPHMARGDAWPNSGGEPSKFWCQIAFSDSRDIVGETPSDLLLVFRNYQIPARCEGAFEFRWVEAVEGEDLWTASDVPDGCCRARSLDAVRVRDVDFCEDLEDPIEAQSVAPAIKVGGMPLLGQGLSDDWPPSRCKYIAQIVTLMPRVAVSYPMIGHPAPLNEGEVWLPEYNFFESELRVAIYLCPDGRLTTFVTHH
ncbi:MAG: DUF1963 domain-containing protein [Planctomycetes bacterium]|nr:DUF1963 domain-containing protein [Planctomycetota bacterium]